MCAMVYHRAPISEVPQQPNQRQRRTKSTFNQPERLRGTRERYQHDEHPVPATYLSGGEAGENERTINKCIQHGR